MSRGSVCLCVCVRASACVCVCGGRVLQGVPFTLKGKVKCIVGWAAGLLAPQGRRHQADSASLVKEGFR
eukprot:12911117-Prorocentrum_lima.AAC.1